MKKISKRLSLIITRYIKGKIRLGQKVTGGKKRDISEAGRKIERKYQKPTEGANFNSKYKGNLTITVIFLSLWQLRLKKIS